MCFAGDKLHPGAPPTGDTRLHPKGPTSCVVQIHPGAFTDKYGQALTGPLFTSAGEPGEWCYVGEMRLSSTLYPEAHGLKGEGDIELLGKGSMGQ